MGAQDSTRFETEQDRRCVGASAWKKAVFVPSGDSGVVCLKNVRSRRLHGVKGAELPCGVWYLAPQNRHLREEALTELCEIEGGAKGGVLQVDDPQEMERGRLVRHDRRPCWGRLTPSVVFVEHVAAVAVKVA